MTTEEFLAHLYSMFCYTTGSEDTYWDYREADDSTWDIHSVNQDGESVFVGYFDAEADADFVTAIHGSLVDLIRLVEDSVHKADMYELAHDQCQRELFEAEKDIMELKEILEMKGQGRLAIKEQRNK